MGRSSVREMTTCCFRFMQISDMATADEAGTGRPVREQTTETPNRGRTGVVPELRIKQ